MRRHRATGPMRPLPSAFVDDLLDHWREHGRKALDRVRIWAPERYLRLVAALAPDGMAKHDALAAMTDEELNREFCEIMSGLAAAGQLPPFLRLVRPDDHDDKE